MSVTRLGPTAFLLNNNRDLIAGGYAGHSLSGALASAQFFDASIPPPTPPPAVILAYPNGGEKLRGTADIRLSIIQPQGKRIVLSMFLNDLSIAFNGGATVQPNADGSTVDVVRTFDTTTKADGKDAYRLKVVAALEENPAVSSQVVSAAPPSPSITELHTSGYLLMNTLRYWSKLATTVPNSYFTRLFRIAWTRHRYLPLAER